LPVKDKSRGFNERGFAKMDAKGVVISYATGLGEIANDEITYTSQLIKAIQAQANQPIEVVLSEAQELTAQATGDRQTPWYEKGMVGKFCFGTCGRKSASDDELERLREENERLRNANLLPPEKIPQIINDKDCREYKTRIDGKQEEIYGYVCRQPDNTWQEETPIIQDKLKDGSFGPEMVRIPTGTFQMGSNDGEDDEKPVRTVSVKSFYMGKYEVMFEEYDKFCEVTGRDKPKDQGWGRGKRPVINISWNDAKSYTKWLSEQTGKDYRLPSEAQWEYACRAGSAGKYSFGDDENQLGNYGWYRSNSGSKTHPVGEKQANKFGLYDMHGNVWEWLENVNRRGGSWYFESYLLRCAFHRGKDTIGNIDNGFRISKM